MLFAKSSAAGTPVSGTPVVADTVSVSVGKSCAALVANAVAIGVGKVTAGSRACTVFPVVTDTVSVGICKPPADICVCTVYSVAASAEAGVSVTCAASGC